MTRLNIPNESGHTLVEERTKIEDLLEEFFAKGHGVYMMNAATKEKEMALGVDDPRLWEADDLYLIAPFAGG